MTPDNNGRGPSWRWLNNLLTAIVGALVVTIGVMAWQQIGTLNQDIRELRESVTKLTALTIVCRDRLDEQAGQLERMEATLSGRGDPVTPSGPRHEAR